MLNKLVISAFCAVLALIVIYYILAAMLLASIFAALWHFVFR